MDLLRFFFPFLIATLAWLVVSQVIAGLLAEPHTQEQVVIMWWVVFLAPFLLAILLVSWLQMLCKMGMYDAKRMMTLWQVSFQRPSQDIRDYLP